MEPAASEEGFFERYVAKFNAQNYDELKEACNGEKFTDESFPLTWDTIRHTCPRKKDKYQYRRLSEIHGDGLKLFDGIEPKDVSQGKLNFTTSYFMASLAELAIRPERIKKLFKEDEVN